MFSENSHPPCTDFEFNVSAVSGEYGENNKSAIVGGFGSGKFYYYYLLLLFVNLSILRVHNK